MSVLNAVKVFVCRKSVGPSGPDRRAWVLSAVRCLLDSAACSLLCAICCLLSAVRCPSGTLWGGSRVGQLFPMGGNSGSPRSAALWLPDPHPWRPGPPRLAPRSGPEPAGAIQDPQIATQDPIKSAQDRLTRPQEPPIVIQDRPKSRNKSPRGAKKQPQITKSCRSRNTFKHCFSIVFQARDRSRAAQERPRRAGQERPRAP